MIPPLVITLLVVVTVVAPTTVETVTRGRSLGKLAVGGRIVRPDGGAIGFRHAFLRALLGVLELWFTLGRSEEHTSELQSLMRISYAVFCLTTHTEMVTRSRSTLEHRNWTHWPDTHT